MENLKSLLTVPYNQDNFKKFSINFLKNVESVPIIENINIPLTFKNTIKSYSIFGKYEDEEKNKILILSVKVKDNSNAQKTQRQFISYLLSNEFLDYTAALVAYYDEVRKNWKLSFVTIDYELVDKNIILKFKPSKRFSFLVGEDEPCKTYIQQLSDVYGKDKAPTLKEINEAFSVTRISDDFYRDYKTKFFELYDFLLLNSAFKDEAKKIGYQDNEIFKFAVTFCKKTLGQIMFLFFVQKKGWLAVEENWGDGDKQYLLNSIKNIGNKNYFNDFLEPLFYEALNVRRDNDYYNGKKIPFLNGGLFHPIENYDWENTNFNIPNDYWFNKEEDGLLNIMSQYNFTVDESNPDEQEIAIDPEMLGKIFEDLLDTNDRSDLGAYYTPREIVHYMCEEAIASRLSKILELDYKSILNFVRYGDALKEDEFIREFAEDIDKYLSKITIVDPAVGSGAFLVGMLNQVVKLRINLMKYTNKNVDKYQMKLEAIQNSLYGVDVEYDAVEIAKLRLWLSLIVDQKTNGNSPKPLPNLNFHLRVGNSLVDTFDGIKLWSSKWRGTKKKVKEYHQLNLFNTETIDIILSRLKSAKVRYFSTSDDKEKQKLLAQIEREQIELIRSELIAKGKFELFDKIESMINKKTKPFFIWELEFGEVFENDGFDIVIANPPYIKEYTNASAFDNLRDNEYYQGKTDLWNIFACKSIDLLKNGGIQVFIAPNNWTTNYGASIMRNKVLTESMILKYIDFGSSMIFDSASIQTMIYVLEKNKNLICNKEYNFEYIKAVSKIDSVNELNMFLREPTLTENIYYLQSIVPNDFVDKYITFADPKISKINQKIRDKGEYYLTKDKVSQGIVVPQTNLNKKAVEKLGNNYCVGQGVFVLNSVEIPQLCLSADEEKNLKPLLMTENIEDYSIDKQTIDKYIIYGDEYFKKNIDKYPLLKKHLDQFKSIMTSDNKPYGLHRPRKASLFSKSERIFSLRKCITPTFAYTTEEMYCLQTFNVIVQNDVDNIYLTGYLNSSIVKFWLKHNGKMQGDNYQIDKEPLIMIPIPIDDNLIIKIKDLTIKILNHENVIETREEIDQILFDYMELSVDEIKFIAEDIK